MQGIFAPSRRPLLLLVVSLALVAVVLLRGINKGEFSENVDETVHASTGLYVASFLHDLPLRHPVQYTYRYYAQYPSLGIIMYPPAFYAIEGVAFFLFGPSVVTARATVVVLALLGLFFWFKLVNELEDEYTAALATVLLAFMPAVLKYEKVVMLDIPLMAFCLAASYFWIVYLRRGSAKLLYGFAVFFCLACLTKHHAIYLPIWCLITLVALKKWDRMLNRRAILTAAVCCLIIAPVYIFGILMNPSLGRNVGGTAANSTMDLTYYWSKLPELIGWSALIFSICGALLSLWRGKRDNVIIMLAWILSCYVFFTLIPHKEPRYIFYWIPAFVYFAVAPFTQRASPTSSASPAGLRISGMALIVLLLASYTARAWKYQRDYVSGYGELAKQLTAREGGCVLVDMDLPGNFIFFMRAYDPARRFVILRKALYETEIMREWGITEFAHNQSDVEKILKADGVRYIAVETNRNLFVPAQSALRDLLHDSTQYRIEQTVAIESNMSDWQGRSLQLYESQTPVGTPHGILHIKMPTLRHDIDIPFDELTRK